MNRALTGLSYEQASRKGEELIRKAADTGNWHAIVEDLVQLRNLMLTLRGNLPRS